MTQDLLVKCIKLFANFYNSEISSVEFCHKYEKIWNIMVKNKISFHPIIDIELLGELYLDYDAFRKKPNYNNYEINEYELRDRCLETIKAIILLNPSLKSYLKNPRIIDKTYSQKEVKNRLLKNGRMLLMLKDSKIKRFILAIWITFDRNNDNYFASIKKWSLRINEIKNEYSREIEYGFKTLESLFNYLEKDKSLNLYYWMDKTTRGKR